MRILIVVPDSDLLTHAELVSSASENRPTILSGLVTTREVISHIETGEYDAIHFGGHSNSSSLKMSDGMLHFTELEYAFDSAAQSGKPVRLCLLNGCRSIANAARLHRMGNGGPGYVIGWASDIDDVVASYFAVHFWRNMHVSSDVHAVFSGAVAALRDKYASLYDDFEPPILINGSRAMLQLMTVRLDDMTAKNDELSRNLARNQFINLGTLFLLGFISIAIFMMVLRLYG
jgi:hypothetical protein